MKSHERVGPISWTGKCEACAVAIAQENVLALIEHRGPRFNAWRRGMAASVGAPVPTDLQEAG